MAKTADPGGGGQPGGAGDGGRPAAAQRDGDAQVAHPQLGQAGRRRRPGRARPRSGPTCAPPSSTAIVAGTAPPARTASSSSSATSRLSGAGSPWASSVLSSATTGRPVLSASATSGTGGRGDGTGCTPASWRRHRRPRCCPTSSSRIPRARTPRRRHTRRCLHYVLKTKIAESAVMGNLVVALCGETFPVTRAQAGQPGVPGLQEDLRGQLKKDPGCPRGRLHEERGRAPATGALQQLGALGGAQCEGRIHSSSAASVPA